MHWMFMPLRRYADFNGRSRRLEYWMFQLMLTVIFVVPAVLYFSAVVLGQRDQIGDPAPLAVLLGISAIVGLAIIVPSIAVQVRRFHDQDRSGLLVLLNFIPYVGGLVVLVFMLLPGTKGPNQYGPDPKDVTGGDVSSVFQ